jgi:hypothetical protein
MKKSKLLALSLSLGLLLSSVSPAFASNVETEDVSYIETIESANKYNKLSEQTKRKIKELKDSIEKNLVQARAAELLLDRYPNSVRKVRHEIIELLQESQD